MRGVVIVVVVLALITLGLWALRWSEGPAGGGSGTQGGGCNVCSL